MAALRPSRTGASAPLILILTLTAMLTSYIAADAATARGEIPRAARKYLPQVVREAHYRNLDPAIAAGQIHQESRWDSSATSAFAAGLAQFTPETEAWVKSTFPRQLENGAGSSDPRWAIRAMCLYDRWLLDRLAQEPRDNNGAAKPAETAPYNPGRESPLRGQSYPDALRAYNGGLGYVVKERSCTVSTPSQPSPSQGDGAGGVRKSASAAFDCCRRFRTGKSCTENLAYPEMILTHWAPMYRAIISPFGGES